MLDELSMLIILSTAWYSLPIPVSPIPLTYTLIVEASTLGLSMINFWSVEPSTKNWVVRNDPWKTSINGSPIQSEFDINQNQIPRGGLVVSFGSTPGLGYAPLTGANVKAKKDSSGALTEIVGINTWVNPAPITSADYNNISGLIEIETSNEHYLKLGDRVKLENLIFQCDTGSGLTNKVYPDHRSFDIFNIINSKKLVVNVGVSTIVHTYISGGEIYEHFLKYWLDIENRYLSELLI